VQFGIEAVPPAPASRAHHAVLEHGCQPGRGAPSLRDQNPQAILFQLDGAGWSTSSRSAGIHFYTQWFERLGATPLSVLLGGVVMLASAFALWMFNRRVVDA
jgi:hypothetical protein